MTGQGKHSGFPRPAGLSTKGLARPADGASTRYRASLGPSACRSAEVSLIELFMPKTEAAEVTEISGVLTRFGMSKANDIFDYFAFRLDGYAETFVIRMDAAHPCVYLGLVAPGDTITAKGTLKEGVIGDCRFEVTLDGKAYDFRATLNVHA